MAVLLVVLLALVAVVAVVALLALRRVPIGFSPSAPAFRCTLRPAGRPDHPEHADWPRRRWAATWVREVLVLRRGVLVPRTRVLAVRMLDAPLREAAPGEVRRLGPDPVVVLLRLDDDTLVEVAAPHDHRTVLVGPFLAAAVPGLPPGPREQPPRLRRPPAPPPRQERES